MNEIPGQHVDPVTMVDYARGRLSRQRAAGVRQHCHGCADCSDQLAAVILLRQHVEVEAGPRSWRPIAAAAALVLLAGAVALAASGGSLTSILSPEPGPLPVAERTEEAPTSPPAPSHLPAPLQDAEFRAFAGTALGFVIRSSLGESVPAGGDLPEGILQQARSRFARADFAAAAEVLAPFAQRPHGLGTRLLAISLYLAGETAAAEPLLVDAHRHLALGPGTEWRSAVNATQLLLAFSLVERGRTTEAVEILQRSLYHLGPGEKGDHFQQQARALLQEVAAPER